MRRKPSNEAATRAARAAARRGGAAEGGVLAGRLRESLLVILAIAAVYLAVCLISYNPGDPGFSHAGNAARIANRGGLAGAWLADFSLSFFGLAGYLLPFLLFYLGVRQLPRDDRPETERWAPAIYLGGLIVAVVSGAALLAIHASADFAPLPEGFGAGGIVGSLVSRPFVPLLAVTGTTLLMLALLLSGITLFTGLSWLWLMDTTGALALAAWHRSRDIADDLKDWIAGRRARAQRDDLRRQETVRQARREPPKIELRPPPPVPEPTVQERQRPLFKHLPAAGLPPLDLLDEPPRAMQGYSAEALAALSRQVELKLADFNVEAEVVAVHPGPVVTRFELQPAAGVKVSQISSLAKDLARGLSVISVRIVEVIPGKSVVGLEIPNQRRELVYLREILESPTYQKSHSPLTLGLGKDIGGHPVVADISRMPHLLVAGTTGSGKSVALNAMILSLLYKATAEQVRLIMIDPKMLELSVYQGIPHLLAPVVTDMKDAANALRWGVGEMDRRYRLMATLGVRNLAGFNRRINEARQAGKPLTDPFFDAAGAPPGTLPPALPTLPNIVIVVDEFADLMMIVGKKVEELIARLAQKARASGIHLLLATQRPSVDVITGLIKANIPARIAFQVSSRIDSRTILDQSGAEQLLGHGDMLFLPPGSALPERVHGAYVADHEVHKVVEMLRAMGEPDYLAAVLEDVQTDGNGQLIGATGLPEGPPGGEQDEYYDQAVEFVIESRRASISSVQRQLRIGYNRAARLIEDMEAAGIVSPPEHNGQRQVLVPRRSRE